MTNFEKRESVRLMTTEEQLQLEILHRLKSIEKQLDLLIAFNPRISSGRQLRPLIGTPEEDLS